MKKAGIAVGLLLVTLTGCNSAVSKDAPQGPDETGDSTHSTKQHPTEGVWTTRSAILGGVAVPSDQMGEMTLTMSGGEYQVRAAGTVDSGLCTLDDKVTPRRMTIQGVAGPNAGKTYTAIYEFPDESTMRVCYDLSGKECPAAFESPAGSELFLVEYKRLAAAANLGH